MNVNQNAVKSANVATNANRPASAGPFKRPFEVAQRQIGDVIILNLNGMFGPGERLDLRKALPEFGTQTQNPET